jgi:hypothetical protein
LGLQIISLVCYNRMILAILQIRRSRYAMISMWGDGGDHCGPPLMVAGSVARSRPDIQAVHVPSSHISDTTTILAT